MLVLYFDDQAQHILVLTPKVEGAPYRQFCSCHAERPHTVRFGSIWTMTEFL